MAFGNKKGLLSDTRMGQAFGGVGDALREGFQGIGQGGIFGQRRRNRRSAENAAMNEEAAMAAAVNPNLQTNTVDEINSTGTGTVGMSELAMEDPMLAASVNGRNLSPYTKKGKVEKVDAVTGAIQKSNEGPIVRTKGAGRANPYAAFTAFDGSAIKLPSVQQQVDKYEKQVTDKKTRDRLIQAYKSTK